MNQSFLITGVYRSGTTLTDKLLHAHPDLAVGSQPFPSLFIDLKKRFLSQKGIEKTYPIDPLFMEDQYHNDEFNQFLDTYPIDSKAREQIFKNLEAYDGVRTPGFITYCINQGVITNPHADRFATLYATLMSMLETYLGKPQALLAGSKEIICEEYIPWFLSHHKLIIHIIRDPRDIIASLSQGDGRAFMGSVRPALYTLRMWRKSAAFSFAFSGEPHYHLVRYEDLVTNPLPVLNQIADFLGVAPFSQDWFSEGIHDQEGNLWKANSSFEAYRLISPDSMGKYPSRLSPEMIQYIELVCFPEMKLLGYADFEPP